MKIIRSIKTLLIILLICISNVISYVWGRKDNQIIYETEYIKGEEITKEILIPKPYFVKDTIYQKIDTVALYSAWSDYHKIRNYVLDFSDDNIGVFKVNLSVSKNKICDSPKAIIQPNILTITENSKVSNIRNNKTNNIKNVQGYVMLGTNIDGGTNQIQAGIDLKQRFMLGASGICMNNNWGYTINFGIKF